MAVTKNSINVEANKPIKDPEAAFKAVRESTLFNISPIKAPRKGPIRIAKGTGIKIPATNPVVAPSIPALLPPRYLVPSAGIAYCKAKIIIVINKVIPRNV